MATVKPGSLQARQLISAGGGGGGGGGGDTRGYYTLCLKDIRQAAVSQQSWQGKLVCGGTKLDVLLKF